jgi:hypothetical protein
MASLNVIQAMRHYITKAAQQVKGMKALILDPDTVRCIRKLIILFQDFKLGSQNSRRSVPSRPRSVLFFARIRFPPIGPFSPQRNIF